MSITKDPPEPATGYEVDTTITVTLETLLDEEKPVMEQTLWVSVTSGITAEGYSSTLKSVITTSGKLALTAACGRSVTARGYATTAT